MGRLTTRLTTLLGVEHPVMLAGMGGVSYSRLCAAVSGAGGFGCLGAASMKPAKLQAEMQAVRALTDRPFGVDLLTPLPEDVERALATIIDGGAALYVAALGVPRDVVDRLHDAGVLVACMCGTAKHARRAVAAGCDLVVAQGTEAGGHTGAVATLVLVPAVVDAVGSDVPVVAAGGIADGRGLAAALALGADGVWIGTRFVATPEARRLEGFAEAVLATHEDGTVITRAYSGKTMRVVPNAWTLHYEEHPEELLPFPGQMRHAVAAGATHLGASEGTPVDPTIEAYLCGQAAGLVHEVVPARQVVTTMVDDAVAILGRLGAGVAAPERPPR